MSLEDAMVAETIYTPHQMLWALRDRASTEIEAAIAFSPKA